MTGLKKEAERERERPTIEPNSHTHTHTLPHCVTHNDNKGGGGTRSSQLCVYSMTGVNKSTKHRPVEITK